MIYYQRYQISAFQIFLTSGFALSHVTAKSLPSQCSTSCPPNSQTSSATDAAAQATQVTAAHLEASPLAPSHLKKYLQEGEGFERVALIDLSLTSRSRRALDRKLLSILDMLCSRNNTLDTCRMPLLVEGNTRTNLLDLFLTFVVVELTFRLDISRADRWE
jgi:hypothetical protein